MTERAGSTDDEQAVAMTSEHHDITALCVQGHHAECPGVVGNDPRVPCTCPCHSESDNQRAGSLDDEAPEDRICEVCGEALVDWNCPNDGDRHHDRIQEEVWEARGVRDE